MLLFQIEQLLPTAHFDGRMVQVRGHERTKGRTFVTPSKHLDHVLPAMHGLTQNERRDGKKPITSSTKRYPFGITSCRENLLLLAAFPALKIVDRHCSFKDSLPD